LITFRNHAAQPYEDRILRFVVGDTVSIWTLAGRMKIPFICGECQRALLAFRKRQVDLMLVRGTWYLAVVCDVADPTKIGIVDVLGLDCGVVNLAYDSDGRPYSGAEVERVRQKFSLRRAGLQHCGTKAAKRRLKKLRGKEAGFRKHVNHCISKEIVVVDPRNTSRTCSECGSIHKANRKSQQTFSCVDCGYTAAADFVGARNIRASGAAVVTSPPESERDAHT
jgi:putative transposase